MSLLSVEGATLVRGGRLLFEGLDLTLGAGEAAHVTGPNGCGKSSLIRMVAGLLTPSAGRIERAAVALADEGLALDRELPLRRALAFWGGPKLSEAMTAFDLDRLAEVPVRLLSTGQAKRARLARVMASAAPCGCSTSRSTGSTVTASRGSTSRSRRIVRAGARCWRRAIMRSAASGAR